MFRANIKPIKIQNWILIGFYFVKRSFSKNIS